MQALRLSIFTALALLMPVEHAVAKSNIKSNIALVFLDNFGWGEQGFNGGGIYGSVSG